MSRRGRSRISRALVGVMVLTVGVGAGVYYFKSGKDQQQAAATTRPAGTGAAQQQAKAQQPVVLSAPVQLMASESVKPEGATTEPVVRVTVATTGPATRAVVATTEPSVPTTGLVAEGKAKIDGGEPVAGRKVLNDALLSGALSAEEAAAAKGLMAEANKAIVFSGRRFAADSFQGTHTVQAGERLQKIAYTDGVTWEFLGRINGLDDPRRMRAGATLKTIPGPFHAVVTKSTFSMDIYLGSPGKAGSMYVTTLPVGLGANDSTPTGTWTAGGKLKNPAYFSPRGEGIIAADDPQNPLGEYWVGLTGVEGQAVGKVSYGIHGTIDPASIGTQSSMGCIRLRNEDIALVYELLVEGKSTVVVRE